MKRSLLPLLPDDRDHLRLLVDAEVEMADKRGSPETWTIAERVWASVEKKATAGEKWTERVLKTCAIGGLRSEVLSAMREDSGVITLSSTGEVVRVNARMGILRHSKKRSKDKQVEHFQQMLWWELDWDEFVALINRMDAFFGVIGVKVAALREVERLRLTYPETRTPGEACEQAGIDPRAFKIG